MRLSATSRNRAAHDGAWAGRLGDLSWPSVPGVPGQRRGLARVLWGPRIPSGFAPRTATSVFVMPRTGITEDCGDVFDTGQILDAAARAQARGAAVRHYFRNLEVRRPSQPSPPPWNKLLTERSRCCWPISRIDPILTAGWAVYLGKILTPRCLCRGWRVSAFGVPRPSKGAARGSACTACLFTKAISCAPYTSMQSRTPRGSSRWGVTLTFSRKRVSRLPEQGLQGSNARNEKVSVSEYDFPSDERM